MLLRFLLPSPTHIVDGGIQLAAAPKKITYAKKANLGTVVAVLDDLDEGKVVDSHGRNKQDRTHHNNPKS